MSFKNWLKKHYPTDAESLRKSSDLECIEHSLTKWKGALEENLFGGKYVFFQVRFEDSDDRFNFDATSCALCQKYPIDCFSEDNVRCPIIRMQGFACDEQAEDIKLNTYVASYYDPQPMIDLLTATKEFLLKEEPPCK